MGADGVDVGQQGGAQHDDHFADAAAGEGLSGDEFADAGLRQVEDRRGFRDGEVMARDAPAEGVEQGGAVAAAVPAGGAVAGVEDPPLVLQGAQSVVDAAGGGVGGDEVRGGRSEG
ncbi:hypothetical protein GCM10027187_40480 [Streptosporangium sandarakinum]